MWLSGKANVQVKPATRPRLTVGEVAERLGISAETLCHWMKAGTGPPHYRLGRQGRGNRWIRFDPVELETWIQAHRVDGGAA